MAHTFRHSRHAVTLILGLATALICQAQARADIIQNGNFETGDFTGWSTTGNVALVGVPFFGEGSTGADGNYMAAFNAGNATPNGTLSQTFATVAGTVYQLNFNYGANGGAIQSITSALQDNGGTVLATQFNTLPAPSSALSAFSLLFTADSASTTLIFTDYPGNPTVSTDGFIDNVQVSAVPEPSSVALMGIALALIPLTRRLGPAKAIKST